MNIIVIGIVVIVGLVLLAITVIAGMAFYYDSKCQKYKDENDDVCAACSKDCETCRPHLEELTGKLLEDNKKRTEEFKKLSRLFGKY